MLTNYSTPPDGMCTKGVQGERIVIINKPGLFIVIHDEDGYKASSTMILGAR